MRAKNEREKSPSQSTNAVNGISRIPEQLRSECESGNDFSNSRAYLTTLNGREWVNRDHRPLLVTNAGTTYANGVYMRDGIYNGKPQYINSTNDTGLSIRFRLGQWRLGWPNDYLYVSEARESVLTGWREARENANPPEFKNPDTRAPAPKFEFRKQKQYNVQIVWFNMVEQAQSNFAEELWLQTSGAQREGYWKKQHDERVERLEVIYVKKQRALAFARAMAMPSSQRARKARAAVAATKATGAAAEAAARAAAAAGRAEESSWATYVWIRDMRASMGMAYSHAIDAARHAQAAAVVAAGLAAAAVAACVAFRVAATAAYKASRFEGKAHRAWQHSQKKQAQQLKTEAILRAEALARDTAEAALRELGIKKGATSREIDDAATRLLRSKRLRKKEPERLPRVQAARNLLMGVDTDPLIIRFSENPDR
jgi:hypothetical protein